MTQPRTDQPGTAPTGAAGQEGPAQHGGAGAEPDSVQEAERTGVPADYRLLLPDGWYRIPLDPDKRERSVNALVERQYRGVDNAPHLKDQTRRELLARAEEAHRRGGIELYLSLQTAGPLPIPASLLITLVHPPNPGGIPLEALAQRFADDGPVGQDVTIETLRAGAAVRVRNRTVPPPDDPSGNPMPVTSVDYHVPVPGTGAFLVLAFSTPMDPLADAMTKLFDVIAGSLTWTG